jgi:glutamyl-tRNA synthetase
MEKLINLIFGNSLPMVEEIYSKYPPRNLLPEQKVTRIAPSPTGFVHLGTIYMGLICERVAHRSNGVFFVRIEDTDTKREVEGSADTLAKTFIKYNIIADEGMISGDKSIGNYGPYKQSERKHIYKAFARDLMKQNMAYPCFCGEEELENIVSQQKAQNCSRLGYYGGWAKYRNFPIEEAIKKIENGDEYVIRFRSDGNFNKKIVINDVLKGNVEFPENDLDIVLIKRDGLPTYHFAHVVDDFLMGTNLVSRGDEWLPSTPLHLQLFHAMRWRSPKYAHISPIMKMDNGGKRKLSKRKDLESNVEYFDELGYPKESVIEYLMNLANSNFEDWRKQNPQESYLNFPFDIKKMNTSGALFDFAKLASVSREVVGRMTAQQIYDYTAVWAEKYDERLNKILQNNKEKCLQIFNIERDDSKKVRKDIEKWSDVGGEIMYYFEYDAKKVRKMLNEFDDGDVRYILETFANDYDMGDANDEWFNKIKAIAKTLNYAVDIKEYKNNANVYKGSVSDVAKILRIVVTMKEQSPNLYEIMKIIGGTGVIERLQKVMLLESVVD